ncbi:MAG: hypothetical protein EU530_10945 [Promethearchaeota archaeon]|nr:MAG: hypothetical protein EU530_10945 [Candidatus Lokiarchaeota archaeon]
MPNTHSKIQKIVVLIALLTLPLCFIPISIVSASLPSISAMSEPIIADHSIVNEVRLNLLDTNLVDDARETLHVGYFHTSHGSQLTSNRLEMIDFMESNYENGQKFNWTEGGVGDSLDLDDYCISGDLGNPDYTTWETLTRPYLNSNPDCNVFMGSWCGQVSGATEENINTYLSLMTGLENDYPNVTFVYMTGHVDGTGLTGNLHIRNEQIRAYCISNNKVLFDFADIESYDPDGTYFGHLNVQDDCDYDGGNWATEWQDSHTEGVDWFSCSSAHSYPLNANMKTYAMWWMFAMIAAGEVIDPQDPRPNPLTPREILIYVGIGTGTLIILGCVTALILHNKKKK